MSLILSGTDGLSDIDGTAATPAIRGTDANTGIFFPAADTIAFSEGGAEAMRIDSSGNVGIGIAPSISGAKLTTVGGSVQLSPGTTSQEGIRLTRASGICQINGINNDNNAYNALTFATGASEAMRIDTSGNLQFNSGYGSVATAYGCRAWVNFNGVGTVAIRGSGNVTSITDNGTGDYTVNFTTAMPDANYSISTSATYFNGNNPSLLLHGPKNQTSYSNTFATTSVRVQSSDQDQNAFDAGIFCVGVFR
jgi:hypothetical protein